MKRQPAPKGFSLTLTTCKDLRQARDMAQMLLGQRLAACVNLLPKMESHYRWQGRLEKSAEVLLIIKSRAALHKKIQQAICANHSYDLPEVIHFGLDGGLPEYLKWLKESL